MSDPQNGKTDKPRNPHNVKRPYREVDIDWSRDAKGDPRMNRQGTKAIPSAAEEFAGGQTTSYNHNR